MTHINHKSQQVLVRIILLWILEVNKGSCIETGIYCQLLTDSGGRLLAALSFLCSS